MRTQFWKSFLILTVVTYASRNLLSAEDNVKKLKISENEHEVVKITRLILEFSNSFLSQSIYLKLRL